MQMFPIILVAAVLAVDGGLTPLGGEWNFPKTWVWIDLGLVPLLLVVNAWLVVSVSVRQLRRNGRASTMLTAERTVRLTRWLIVINHLVAILVLDAMASVRSVAGDHILIDELLAIAPAMVALLGTWWVFYPVEQHLVHSMLIRRLDLGAPVYPMLTRWQYVVVQTRMQVLLTLVPVLVIAGLSEAIDDLWLHWKIGWLGGREVMTIAAAACVFLFSPLIARAVLDTQSLPNGPLRDMLAAVCRRHGVGVRDLLLWNTNGSMINAAVMGLVAPLRYVLITDALVETLREDEVRAVMAHEVGHVRRKHMAWLVLCLVACFLLAAHVVEWPLRFSVAAFGLPTSWFETLTIISALLQMALGLTIFGWVCRRFERQADTFAVQHLSGLGMPAAMSGHVTAESVDAMRSALETVAQLNTVDPARHSWRHGSIRWRQRYLTSIVGRPIQQLPIDRLMNILKLATAIVLVAGVAYEILVRASLHDRSEMTGAASHLVTGMKP